MIDTVQLCGRVPPNGLKQPRGPDNKTAADEQWWWIEQTLNSSRYGKISTFVPSHIFDDLKPMYFTFLFYNERTLYYNVYEDLFMNGVLLFYLELNT